VSTSLNFFPGEHKSPKLRAALLAKMQSLDLKKLTPKKTLRCTPRDLVELEIPETPKLQVIDHHIIAG